MAAFVLVAQFLTVAFKWVVMGRFQEQSIQRYDLLVQLYHSYTTLTAQFNGMVLAGGTGTWWARFIFIMYGADIPLWYGPILWGTCLDQDLVTVEAGACVGDGCGICGHNYEHAGLKFKYTRVKAGATMYPSALLMAGDTMEPGSVIGSRSKPFGSSDPCEEKTVNIGCPCNWASFVDRAQDSEYLCVLGGYEDAEREPEVGVLAEDFDEGYHPMEVGRASGDSSGLLDPRQVQLLEGCR